jgi:hypothetical protein
VKGHSLVEHLDDTDGHVYQAPTALVAVFYVILSVWSLICINLLGTILEEGERSIGFPLLMIGFILFYMWYFALAISYRLEFGDEGEIRFKSLRRTVRTYAAEIETVEFPRVGLGFIKFRLEREKVYLFGLTHSSLLKKVLAAIKNANANISFKQFRL